MNECVFGGWRDALLFCVCATVMCFCLLCLLCLQVQVHGSDSEDLIVPRRFTREHFRRVFVVGPAIGMNNT